MLSQTISVIPTIICCKAGFLSRGFRGVPCGDPRGGSEMPVRTNRRILLQYLQYYILPVLSRIFLCIDPLNFTKINAFEIIRCGVLKHELKITRWSQKKYSHIQLPLPFKTPCFQALDSPKIFYFAFHHYISEGQ